MFINVLQNNYTQQYKEPSHIYRVMLKLIRETFLMAPPPCTLSYFSEYLLLKNHELSLRTFLSENSFLATVTFEKLWFIFYIYKNNISPSYVIFICVLL